MAISSAILAAAVMPAAPKLSPQLSSQLSTLSDTLTGRNIALAKLGDVASAFAVNMAVGLLILVVTLWLSKWASRLASAAFERLPGTHRDETLKDFVSSLVRYAVVVIGAIAILNRLGFQTTSIITVLGAASLAVGLALQGALSNLAAGVMVLIFRPYRVGDTVTLASKTGTVKRLDLFNTELADGDGLKVVVPNGKAFGDVITNYTEIPNRRMQLQFGIDYADPIDKAIETVLQVAEADPRILKSPAPWCMVTELADSQVTVELRAWANLDVYWNARYDMLKKVKEAFDAEGITIPYPTQTSVSKAPSPEPDPKPGPSAAKGAPKPV